MMRALDFEQWGKGRFVAGYSPFPGTVVCQLKDVAPSFFTKHKQGAYMVGTDRGEVFDDPRILSEITNGGAGRPEKSPDIWVQVPTAYYVEPNNEWGEVAP